jgi:hypothetical protein
MPVRNAVTESDCLSQAKEMGFDPDASQRICDAIAEDAPNLMDDQYPDTEPDADDLDYNNSELPERKQGWYNPDQTTTDVETRDDDTDLQTATDDTNVDGSTGDANYDLSNEGPDFNHLNRNVDESQNSNGPDTYDFDGNNSTLENNDHIDTHMDYAQKQEAENLADMDTEMQESSDNDGDEEYQPKGKLAVSDSITGGPIGAAAARLPRDLIEVTHLKSSPLINAPDKIITTRQTDSGILTSTHTIGKGDYKDIQNREDHPWGTTHQQAVNDELRHNPYMKTVGHATNGEKNSGIDVKASRPLGSSGAGHWVTIDGNHILLRDGSLKSASVEVDPFESNGHFFIKAFLLDSSVNLNKWGVSPHTLDANVNSFIGKPLVLTENFDHPDSGDPNLDHALLYQELYRIGTVIDVVKNGSRYDAIAEITDPYAVSAWKEGKIPIYVSPQIYKQDYTEPDTSISKWQGTHLALVKDPAFGVKVADFKGSCTGEPDKCLALLKKASIIHQHGYGSCGYCNRKLLLSAKVSHHDNPIQTPKVNAPPQIDTSLDSTNTNLQTSNDLTEAQTKEAQPTKQSTADNLESANKKIASLEQKLSIAMKANEEKDSVNSDLAKRMAALETEMRRDKVAAILSAAEIKEGFEDRVASLAKSNLPIEEIASIYKPYLEAKSVKSASVDSSNNNNNRQEPPGKVQYVESKVSMKNAAVETATHSKPAWLSTRDYLFKGVS